MPPAALGGLVVDLAGLSALRALTALALINHSDVHPQRINIEVNTCNFPRRLQPEQLGVMIGGQIHA
jgi:hypothetical protein